VENVCLPTLLLVDADPAVHELLAPALRRDDRSVAEVYDGREALDRLRSEPYDLVLAGPGSNGLDGPFLLRKINAIRPGIPVILTGDAAPAHVIGAMRARAYSYFHKPLIPGPVAEMVQQALEFPGWQDDIRIISARPEWIGAEVRCKLTAAERMAHFLREADCDLPLPLRDDLSSAFRELLLNAVEHGGKSDPAKRVRVTRWRTARAVTVHIQDPGKGFSMESIDHAAIGNPEGSPIRHAEVRAEQGKRPGGFGILLTRNLVDELLYSERGNEVIFVKYL
jgi:CheY-like chemotaxis protein/anti-sigma regulatory factor (Ser/Thr protein kinase)